jgi:hypothetical protein
VTRSQAVLGWLDDRSDWLSPLVVKEVRQVVRGREFNLSFGASLVAGLAIAFSGAGVALTGDGTSGGWTFIALMGCLAFLGLAVVPLGAFNALRQERAEQTLELITLTALSPRRIVIGKLLAQGVKLATLFAAMAPFIAMSFLLGGIDFVTILVSLVLLFMWSLWACAGCVFLSTLFKSRAMSGVIFGVAGIVAILALAMGRTLLLAASRGMPVFAPVGFGPTGSPQIWILAIATTIWLTTIVNLVLLAENRLRLPTEDRVTPLRVGFFVQFLLIAIWALVFRNEPPGVRAMAAQVLMVVGGGHLAVVATFTVTEDLTVSRQMLRRLTSSSPWRWLIAIFRPGGGRGAAYVLVQMAILLAAAWWFQPAWIQMRWLLAICAYIGFFTGVPTVAFRYLAPSRATPLKLRVAVLVLVAVSMVVPDIVHYLVFRPDMLDLSYAARHLINPVRTLANWRTVETNQWLWMPFTMGFSGLAAYGALVHMGRRMTRQPALIDPPRRVAAAGDLGRADVID